MSTLSIAPTFAAPRRPVVRTPASPAQRGVDHAVRLTRRGRVVLLLAFVVLAMVAMTVFGGLAIATHEAGTPVPVRVVQVQPGDTLYDIAAAHSAPGQVREMMHRIQRLNSMPGTTLQVGQQLAVPRG